MCERSWFSQLVAKLMCKQGINEFETFSTIQQKFTIESFEWINILICIIFFILSIWSAKASLEFYENNTFTDHKDMAPVL